MGAGTAAKSFAFLWDLFSPNGLPYLALMLWYVSGFMVVYYAMSLGGLLFLRGDGGSMDLGERGSGRGRLEEREGRETAVGSNI